MNETEITDTEDQQDWLRKEIPWDWCDKVELIPRLLFTCLINFVDEENGLNQLDGDWDKEVSAGYVNQDYVDNVFKVYGELKEAYTYVKNERPQLLIDLDNSYPVMLNPNEDSFEPLQELENGLWVSVFKTCEERYGKSYEEVYRETNRLEALISEKDQWAMNIITKHVGYLWT